MTNEILFTVVEQARHWIDATWSKRSRGERAALRDATRQLADYVAGLCGGDAVEGLAERQAERHMKRECACGESGPSEECMHALRRTAADVYAERGMCERRGDECVACGDLVCDIRAWAFGATMGR